MEYFDEFDYIFQECASHDPRQLMERMRLHFTENDLAITLLDLYERYLIDDDDDDSSTDLYDSISQLEADEDMFQAVCNDMIDVLISWH
jgi:hypothetical protein